MRESSLSNHVVKYIVCGERQDDERRGDDKPLTCKTQGSNCLSPRVSFAFYTGYFLPFDNNCCPYLPFARGFFIFTQGFIFLMPAKTGCFARKLSTFGK